jgi:hypothetical protein
LVLLAAPAVARANVGPPASGGHVVAEPVDVEGVAITRETLAIDLRPLATNGLAQVEAVYHLQNQGPEKKLDLLFASGSASVADFQVWLGSQPVPSVPANDTELPPSWKAPSGTPGFPGDGELDYLRHGSRRVTPVAFTVTIPPGRHDLRVRYAAEAATHLDGYPTVYRQFAYVLAPAKSWAGFGGLDVTIHLPANWRAACTPALAREGDTLTGSFADLPTDAIALTLQAPEGWAYRPLAGASLGLLGLAGFGGAVVCWKGGRASGRHAAISAEAHSGWLSRHAWPKSVGLGAAWGLAVLGTGLFATFGPDWVLPTGQASHYGYGQAFAMIGVVLLSILAVPVGFGIAQLTAVVVRRREMDKAEKEKGTS